MRTWSQVIRNAHKRMRKVAEDWRQMQYMQRIYNRAVKNAERACRAPGAE